MVPRTRTDDPTPRSVAELARKRARALDLLARHPDLVAGRLDRVAATVCDEGALLLGCTRVGLWRLAGDDVREEAHTGQRFDDLGPRRLTRSAAPAFFLAVERRGRIEGRGIHELATLAPGAAVVTVLVHGSTWGFLSLEGPASDTGFAPADLDAAGLLAAEVGRCVERGQAAATARSLERSEQALASFARLCGDVLCFEVVDGVFEFFGDPRPYLGPAPAGARYGTERLVEHIRPEERELLDRRYDDWVQSGSPGVLTARVHFRLGPVGEDAREVELEWRFLRTRAARGHRLWGTFRRT